MPSIKIRLFKALESFLRVPPLLIVDEIFRISFGIGYNKYQNPEGIVSSVQQRTTYIPDREEGDLSGRLSTKSFENETVIDEISPVVPSFPSVVPKSLPATNYNISDIPLINEIWRFVSEVVDELFSIPHIGLETPSVAKVVEDEVGTKTAFDTPTYSQSDYESSAPQAVFDLIKFMEFFCYIILFFVASFIFILATENLIKLYSHLFSFFALYLSFMFTPFPTALTVATLPTLLYNIACRSIIASIYYTCRSWPGGGGTCTTTTVRGNAGNGNATNDGGTGEIRTGESSLHNGFVLATLTDYLLLGMFFVTGAISMDPIIYVVIMICLHHPLVKCLPDLYLFLVTSLSETKRLQNEYGLSHLLQTESGRLRINMVFRLFWISRAVYDAVSKCCNEPVNSMIKYVMTHGTETFTGVVGLTVTVSAVCHHIGEFLLYLLYNGTNTEADANRFGSISTVLFFILSLQTGLTSLDPEKRLDRLAKNIVLLGTALFHALHQMIAPVLTAFRAFQTLQIRAAVLSCSAFIGSSFLTFYLIRHATVSTWSLAVLALAIEFKVKVCISLLISFVVYLSQLVQYPEFLERFVNICRRILPTFIVRFFDHLHDELSHEDVVFYLRSVANVGEFLTGIFLFANAVWIFFFESASAIRAIGMSVHAYFNIWCEAQKGWRVYCQRKTASQKIMSLADATEEQLKARQDDVCAVCYEEMESAKVTNCNHLFHAVCLRKWLYVQNTCPLCHEVLYREDALDSSDNEANTPPPPLPQQPLRQRQNNVPGAVIDTQPVSASASRTNNNNASAERLQQQQSFDDNDGDLGYSGGVNRAPGDSSAMGGRGTVYTPMSSNASSSGASSGAAMSFQRGTSESGNSSSETEYTVDGSDDDDLWAEDFSDSDDDDDETSLRPRHHRAHGGIGVPLLL